MSELERARAHLLACQEGLLHTRRIGWTTYVVEWREQTVLAALSWVWEEQMKENIERNANRFVSSFIRGRPVT